MPSKLYVSNLSQVTTLKSMRELFGTCGEVLDVEFAAERNARSFPSAAYVTMRTSVDADRAVSSLHGRLHGDRVLVVSRSGEDAASSSAPSVPSRRTPPTDARIAITQQYRDLRGLTYELKCDGKLLTLRFSYPADDAHDWQVEAQLAPGSTSAVSAGGMTRPTAFQALVEAWGAAGNQLTAPELDWESVATALRAVRAL